MIGFIVVSDEKRNPRLEPVRIQPINEKYEIWFYEEQNIPALSVREYSYSAIPKCLGLLEDIALEETGIAKLQNYPTLSLKGQGVFIAIIDTGINIFDTTFLDEYGKSRIFRLWDQQENREFTQEEINELIEKNLNEDDSLNLDKSLELDSDGHGTFLASVSAGGKAQDGQFSGAAPEAELLVVRLNRVGKKLRDFYFIPEDTSVFSESDIMLGIKWADDIAREENRPLVILMGAGCNNGSHMGTSYLCDYLNEIATFRHRVVVTATGNDALASHHFFGKITSPTEPARVEMNVEENMKGFYLEVWGKAPERFSLQLLSPTGSLLPRTRASYGDYFQGEFVFERTRITIDYRRVGRETKDTLIFLRAEQVVKGIWTVLIYPENVVTGEFNIWLPMQSMLESSVRFLNPNPYNTLAMPSDAKVVISVGGEDTKGGGTYLQSGRGALSEYNIKPDLVAPAVDIAGNNLRGDLIRVTGTSGAAALTAGACAQFLQWGVVEEKAIDINNVDIKNQLIRGARRSIGEIYPNPLSGYGKIDVYESLRLVL